MVVAKFANTTQKDNKKDKGELRMEMDIIVNLATILSPIIAVLIAGWTVKKSAIDTNRKIAALEDNMRKLFKLQADITTLQLDMELWETHFRLHKLSGKTGNVLEENRNIRKELDKVIVEELNEEEKDHYIKEVYFDNQLRSLEGHMKRLEGIKREMGL